MKVDDEVNNIVIDHLVNNVFNGHTLDPSIVLIFLQDANYDVDLAIRNINLQLFPSQNSSSSTVASSSTTTATVSVDTTLPAQEDLHANTNDTLIPTNYDEELALSLEFVDANENAQAQLPSSLSSSSATQHGVITLDPTPAPPVLLEQKKKKTWRNNPEIPPPTLDGDSFQASIDNKLGTVPAKTTHHEHHSERLKKDDGSEVIKAEMTAITIEEHAAEKGTLVEEQVVEVMEEEPIDYFDRETRYSLLDLDGDTTLKVFSYLRMRDLLSLSETCTNMAQSTSNNLLWNHFLSERQLMMVYTNKSLISSFDSIGDDNDEEYLLSGVKKSDNSALLAMSHWPSLIRLNPFFTRTPDVPKHFVEFMYDKQNFKHRVNVKRSYAVLSARKALKRKRRNLLERYDPEFIENSPNFTPLITAWIVYGIMAVYSLLYLFIMFPLCLDRYIRTKSAYTWLIAYLPPATILAGFYAILIGAQLYFFDYVPIVTRREIMNWIKMLKMKTTGNIIMREEAILSVSTTMLFIPLLIVLLGVKIGLASVATFKSVYIIIPVVVAQWLFLPPVVIHTKVLSKPDGKTNSVVIIGWILIWLFLSAAMILTALKVDDILPTRFYYSLIFIFYYVGMLLIPATGITYCIVGVRTRSLDFCLALCIGILTIVASIVILGPIFASLLLNGFILDKIVAMPFIAAFSPVIGCAALFGALIPIGSLGYRVGRWLIG